VESAAHRTIVALRQTYHALFPATHPNPVTGLAFNAGSRYVPPMPTPSLFPAPDHPEPVPEVELVAILAEAIRDGRSGRLSRDAAIYLAGVSAEFVAERLALAGVLVVRPRTTQ
jgi:hypothetical protein